MTVRMETSVSQEEPATREHALAENPSPVTMITHAPMTVVKGAKGVYTRVLRVHVMTRTLALRTTLASKENAWVLRKMSVMTTIHVPMMLATTWMAAPISIILPHVMTGTIVP